MTEATEKFTIPKEGELRFEVEEGWLARIQIVQGNAEVFGVPCVLNEPYELDVGKYAVFTWYGCEVNLTSVPQVPRPSGASPLTGAYKTEDQNLAMIAAVNVHGRLEQSREEAAAKQTRGPIAVIVGPGDSGKSTLARLLCSYAARKSKRPIMIDLDPGQTDIGPPGSIGGTTVDIDSISVEEGLSTAGALVYYYGYATPSDSQDYYKKCIEQMARSIESRFALDPAAKSSGCVINTSGWVEGEGYNLLIHAIQTFKADVVLVMGQDQLLNKLKRSLPEAINVIKLPVSGGATARSREFRKRARDRKIRTYFNGSRIGGVPLTPNSQEFSFDEVTILRVPNKDDIADEGILPVGKASTLDPNRARPVDLNSTILNSVLAVSHAESETEVLTKNIAGFVHVQAVDTEARKITLLCPQKGPLPGKFLLMGGVKWIDGAA
jgi:polyribonucleotide 5'-hydroxyl-kinase